MSTEATSRKPKMVPARNNALPLSAERKSAFLRVLAETGSFRAACAAGSPHLDPAAVKPGHAAPGFRTFQDEMRRDPAFAQAVEASLNAAIAKAEASIVDRMNTPTRRPVVANGQLVGTVEEWRDANQLLLRFLERHAPEWVVRKHVDGTVQHQHEHAVGGPGGVGYLVRPQDIGLLPPAEQRTLVELLVKLDDLRKEVEGGLTTAATEPAALAVGTQGEGRPALGA
jgi:hypothetical protein